MKSLFRVYESLLGNMEDNLLNGDFSVEMDYVNNFGEDENSLLKKFFINLDSTKINKNPLSLENTEDGKTLTVKSTKEFLRTSTLSTLFNPDGGDDMLLSDVISNLDTIVVDNSFSIRAHNSELTHKHLARKLISPSLYFNGVKSLDGVNLQTNLFNIKTIQNISFDSSLESLNNLDIDMSISKFDSRIWFNSLPMFNNVSSENVSDIVIYYDKTANLFSEKRFNNIFDFGYELSYKTDPDSTESTKVSVKKFSDIKKLVTAKDFYNRIYNESPIKLKKGARLSDLIDVSKFKELECICINSSNIGIVFENTKTSRNLYKLYFPSMLKIRQQHIYSGNTVNSGLSVDEIVKYLPVTADGWRVMIIRV